MSAAPGPAPTSHAAAPNWPVAEGDVLGGRYRLLRRIGGGSLGAVFEAEHVQIPSRRVAIKVLDPQLTRDPTMRGRLLREVDAASRLAHPNILAVREVDVTDDGLCYCLLDLSTGRSLREVLRAEGGRLAPRRAIAIVVQVLEALQHAHERGVVHRDVKPENILIEAGPAPGVEVARVHDFGLAKLLDDGDAHALTTPGTILGSFQYMAPEQAQGHGVDGRADIYATGIVAFELIAGALPFTEASRVAFLVAHLTKPMPRLSTRAAGIPAELDAAILQATAKDPSGRFPDARSFAAALRALAPRLPTEVSPPSGSAGARSDPGASGSVEAPTVALGPQAAGGARAPAGGRGPGDPLFQSHPTGAAEDPIHATAPTMPGPALAAPPAPGTATAATAPWSTATGAGYARPTPGPGGDFAVGTQIARYRIEGLIGGGGMGRVYRARHIHMGREAALKVLLPHLAEDPIVRERFRREARIAACFRHPNVVELYDYDDLDGLCFLAMELVQGQALDAALRQHGPFEPARAAHLIGQLLDALAAAHAGGVVHRDLKPANVMVQPQDRVKVLDFGIARILDSGSEQSAGALEQGLTLVGSFVGTPAYAAPEQIQGTGVDGRADLYTVGVMLFQLCAGRLPFVADHPRGYLAQHLMDAPPRLASVRAGLAGSEALDAVIARAMQKRPADRFPDAASMREAVARAVEPRRPAFGPSSGAAAPRGTAPSNAAYAADATLPLPGGPPGPSTSGTSAFSTAVSTDASGALTAPGAAGMAGGGPAARAAPPLSPWAQPPGAPRGARLLLACRGIPGLERLFLIGGDRLAFGRGREDRRRGVRNDVVLRVLPCRDPQLDPENWQASVRISQAHGEVRVRGSVATIADTSSRGTLINGVRVAPDVPRGLADHFELDVGAGALCLAGTLGRVPGLPASIDQAATALEVGTPPIACVILRRVANAPLHAYALVVHRLVVGRRATCDVPIDDPAAPDELLAIEATDTGFMVRALQAPAALPTSRRGWLGRLSWGARDEAAPALTLDGSPLALGTAAPLEPGAQISFGAIDLAAHALEDEAFSAL